MNLNLNIKYTRENVKRLALAGLMLVILVIFFQSFLLGPAFQVIKGSSGAIENVDAELTKSASYRKRIEAMRRQVVQNSDLEKTLFVNQPTGDPIAWFPPRVENFFKKAGIPRCLATLSPPSESEIRGFRTYRCTIEFPGISFMQFGAALAAFENSDNLIEVQSLKVGAQTDDPATQSISLTVRVILKPEVLTR
jgi:hypothetical protein